MLNFDKWRSITDGYVSPDSYINIGFYYLISAALQRRVWVGPNHMRLFPNQYIILVGPPGVGKGLIIKSVEEFLRFHKLPDPNKVLEDALKGDCKFTETDREQISLLAQANYKEAKDADDDYQKTKKDFFEEPLLIPVAANATTFQALVQAVAKAIRRKNYRDFDENAKKEVLKIYTHSSLCYCLEEIASLFRKNTDDLINFLLQAYDCGDEYTYDTKTAGKHRLRKLCLNFFGGTTPSFMQSTFDDKLLTEGYASRTIYVYESCNRKATLKIPDLTEEQITFKKDLLLHVKKLTTLYGRITITKEAEDYLEDWWIKSQTNRPNTSTKLEAYYARKNIHVLKMAISMHFSESLDMTMNVEPFDKALKFLSLIERKMHYALSFDKKNPLYTPSNNILHFIQRQGKRTKKEILTEFWGNLPPPVEDSLNDILLHLETTNQLRTVQEKHPKTGILALFYEVVRKENS